MATQPLTVYFPQGPDMSSRYQAKQVVSGAAATLTVQQPATTASGPFKTVVFEFAELVNTDTSVHTFTISQNQPTGASTTAATPQPLNQSPPAAALAFTSSNVSGTAQFTSQTFEIPANSNVFVDLSKFYLSANGGGAQNLTITTDSGMKGSVAIQWLEK